MEMTCLKKLSQRLEALAGQQENSLQAAQIAAQAQKEDRLIHIFASEVGLCGQLNSVFFVPGALTNLDLILDPALDPAHGAYRAALCQPLDNFAPCVLDYYEMIEAEDPMLLLGSDPSLPMFAQALAWAKEKKLKTVAIIAGGDCAADVVLRTGCEDAESGLHCLAAGAFLQQVLTQAAALSGDVWSGGHFVDLDADAQKIDAKLYRVRHL